MRKVIVGAAVAAVGAGMFIWTVGGSASAESNKARVRNARSAAPAAIGRHAAVMDYPGQDGQMKTLAEGDNGWTCLPDWDPSPGNDPMCLDKEGMDWMGAYMAGKAPELKSTAVAYMLQGGSDPSNTDPAAMEPAKGEDWIKTPPHIMVFSPTKLDPAVYGTEPGNGGPYIMFAGTPYEHLMVPIATNGRY